MAIYLEFKHEASGQVREVKVGWSWTCFLFSGFFGLPLYLRELNFWGTVMLGLLTFRLVMDFVGADLLSFIVNFIMLGLAIWFGVKGNEMTARNYLSNGWVFAEPDGDIVSIAKEKWGLPWS